jgi:outer membrane receptor for ferric coprogen and ferric-rhodotorulic acid
MNVLLPVRRWAPVLALTFTHTMTASAAVASADTAGTAPAATPSAKGVPEAPADSVTLPAVRVTAGNELDAVSEGTQSYAAGAVTLFGKQPVATKDIPSSVSVVTRQRMDDQNMTSVSDALNYSTGITAVDYGDGTTYFKSRGYDVGIEFDGVPLASGIQYEPQFDLAMYDRVEVFRGPSGLMDGAGEPGGTVNLVRKMPADTFHFGSQTSIGSYGDYRQQLDVTGPMNDEGTLRGRAVVVGQDQHTFLENEVNKHVMAYGALEYDVSPATMLSFSGGIQSNPLRGFDYGPSLYTDGSPVRGRTTRNYSPDWNYSDINMQEANAVLSHTFSNDWKSRTTLFYRHILSKSDYAYSGGGVDPQTNESDYTGQRQRIVNDWFGLDSNLSGTVSAFGRRHTLTLGANYQLNKQSSRSGFADLGNYDIFSPNDIPRPDIDFTSGTRQRIQQVGVYGQGNIELADPLHLILGGRLAAFSQKSQPFLPESGDWTTSYNERHKFVPYTGLVLDLTPQIATYVSYTKIFSPQSATTWDGQGLPPRTGEQYETGIKGDFMDHRLQSSLALFRINDEHRAIDDPDHPTGSVAGGRARSDGLELELNGNILPQWDIYASYTLLTANYVNDPTYGNARFDDEEPRQQAKLWTLWHFRGGALDGFRVGGGVRAQSETDRDAWQQGGYALVDLQAGYRFNKHLDASLTLNNVFDRDYYARVPSSYFSERGEPRNVMLTVSVDY